MPEREPDAVEQELEATTGFRASVSLLRRNRDFRRLFLASVISLGGDWFLFVAITSLIVETTGRAIDVGLAILAQELAFFIASPPAGVLVDRLDRRTLMIVCDLARIGVCALVPARRRRHDLARVPAARAALRLRRSRSIRPRRPRRRTSWSRATCRPRTR